MRVRRWAVGRAGVGIWIAASMVALAPRGAAGEVLGQWSSNGPGGASILTLATDPQSPSTVYAGSNGPGVFVSSNGGGSWVPINTGLTNTLIRALGVDPQVPATLYAGTNGGGIFKSVNAGATWAPANAGLANTLINALALDPRTPGTLYAGTSGGGVFKSPDAGATWGLANTGLTNTLINALAVDPQIASTLYAGTSGSGVFKSLNAGATWAPSNAGLANALVSAVAVDPQTPSTLYAGTTGGGVFKSVDGALTWAPMNAGLTNTLVVTLAIDPQNPTTLYAGTTGGGVFASADGALTWTPFNAGLTNTVVNAVRINPFSTCLHAGTTSGVFDFAVQENACASAPSPLLAAVLPSSRSVRVGTTATAFATMISTGATSVGCAIAPLTSVPAPFLYQTTNPATNQPTGSPNTPVTIGPGEAQTFLIAFTPTTSFAPTNVLLSFSCANTLPAPVISGLNSLLLGASTALTPDIVALAATTGNNGIVDISGPTGAGAFSVATVNVGGSGQITTSADTGASALPATITICETDPTMGVCLATATPTVTRTIGVGQTVTYGIFVASNGGIPFVPALNRIFVRFKDGAGIIRGSTSVAARTQGPARALRE